MRLMKRFDPLLLGLLLVASCAHGPLHDQRAPSSAPQSISCSQALAHLDAPFLTRADPHWQALAYDPAHRGITRNSASKNDM